MTDDFNLDVEQPMDVVDTSDEPETFEEEVFESEYDDQEEDENLDSEDGDEQEDASETETEDEELDESEDTEADVQMEQRHSRARDRIESLIARNKELNAQLQAVQEQAADSTIPSPMSADGWDMPEALANHPAVRGAEFDDQGNVLYKGAFVPPELAVHMYDMDRSNQQLREMIVADRQERAAAEHQARLAEVQAELAEAVATDIEAQREEVFPDLDKRQAAAVDRQLFVLVDNYVTEAIGEGQEYTPELIQDSTERALSEMRETFGIYGARQVEDNQRHAETYRIKPTGMPGIQQPKPLDRMTKRERESFADQAARAAEAMRG